MQDQQNPPKEETLEVDIEEVTTAAEVEVEEVTTSEKRFNQAGSNWTDTRTITVIMTEELDLPAIQEEITIKDLATIANKEEMKKTGTIVDRIEGSTATRRTEETEVEAETTEIEEIMEEITTMATTGQGLEGAARRLQASGSLLQVTPWP